MSVETQGGSTADRSLTLRRNEGIQTVEQTLPEPARHGAAGMFVLNDADRETEAIPWAAGEHRQLPDGSLYQHARAARYAHEDDLVEDPGGRKRAVLSREYEIDGEAHAVIMTDSRWRAGTGQDEDYRAWYKYDLKLRPLDSDGSIAWSRTPVEALNVKLQPQYKQLVDPDGDPLSLPYNEGTLVHVQSTWVDRPRELLERTQQLVEEALGYELSESFVHPESRRFWKAEVHHRVDAECEADLVHTLRQSQDLLAQHAADVETEGTHKDNTWLKAKVTTREWEQLGFPNIDAQILLKVYYPDNPDAEYPFNQPKIEAALAGATGGVSAWWLHRAATSCPVRLAHPPRFGSWWPVPGEPVSPEIARLCHAKLGAWSPNLCRRGVLGRRPVPRGNGVHSEHPARWRCVAGYLLLRRGDDALHLG
jgi:hypothetical protein